MFGRKKEGIAGLMGHQTVDVEGDVPQGGSKLALIVLPESHTLEDVSIMSEWSRFQVMEQEQPLSHAGPLRGRRKGLVHTVCASLTSHIPQSEGKRGLVNARIAMFANLRGSDTIVFCLVYLPLQLSSRDPEVTGMDGSTFE
jgi:hypothetical protein